MAFPDKVRNKAFVTYIDNAGSCAVWRKGYDLHCGTTDTVLRACDFISVAMCSTPYVAKIARRSTPGAVAADALSKSDWREVQEVTGDMDMEPSARWIPNTLRTWLENPVQTQDLGPMIVREMVDNGFL